MNAIVKPMMDTPIKRRRLADTLKKLKGKMTETVGKLIDDDVMRAKGKSEYLAGRIREREGLLTWSVTEKRVMDFDRIREILDAKPLQKDSCGR